MIIVLPSITPAEAFRERDLLREAHEEIMASPELMDEMLRRLGLDQSPETDKPPMRFQADRDRQEAEYSKAMSLRKGLANFLYREFGDCVQGVTAGNGCCGPGLAAWFTCEPPDGIPSQWEGISVVAYKFYGEVPDREPSASVFP